jgi:hypothetical protein
MESLKVIRITFYLIALLLVLGVLYSKTISNNEPMPDFTYKEPSIITVEELPPIREDNDN